MSIKQVMRWGWSIFLCCLIFFNFNIQSAKAEINLHLPSVQSVNINTDFISDSARYVGNGLNHLVKKDKHPSAIESLSDGFVSGFGQVGGSIAGATAACYVADAAVLPIAPPVAAAVAAYCPYIGGVAGSFGGVVVSKTAEKQATLLSSNLFRLMFSSGEILVGKGFLNVNCPTFDDWAIIYKAPVMTI